MLPCMHINNLHGQHDRHHLMFFVTNTSDVLRRAAAQMQQDLCIDAWCCRLAGRGLKQQMACPDGCDVDAPGSCVFGPKLSGVCYTCLKDTGRVPAADGTCGEQAAIGMLTRQ